MAMQKLNVRFSDEVKMKISDSSIDYKSSESDIARAALIIGLEWLEQKSDIVNPDQMKSIIKTNQKLTA